jgi:hypothetical protein
MKLSEFNNFSEKKNAFSSRRSISSWNELDEFIKTTLQPGCHFIFRGVNEAKYKIYTSAQRKYIEKDLRLKGKSVNDLLEEELNAIRVQNDKLVPRYLKSMGVDDSDLALLSFLQHYEGVSPLIDFSEDIRISLYFMLDNVNSSYSENDTIQNYMSLYCLLPQTQNTDFDCDGETARNFCSFDFLKQKPRTFIIDKQKDTFGNYVQNVANFNIVAQHGKFVFHLDDDKPLTAGVHCLDIHKSLIPQIKAYLDGAGVTKDMVYPDAKTIAHRAFNQAMEKCNA